MDVERRQVVVVAVAKRRTTATTVTPKQLEGGAEDENAELSQVRGKKNIKNILNS